MKLILVLCLLIGAGCSSYNRCMKDLQGKGMSGADAQEVCSARAAGERVPNAETGDEDLPSCTEIGGAGHGPGCEPDD